MPLRKGQKAYFNLAAIKDAFSTWAETKKEFSKGNYTAMDYDEEDDGREDEPEDNM